MKYQIRIDEGVLLDLKEKLDYYDNISIKLGERLYNEFWNKIDYVELYPLHHQLRYKKIRIANLKVFPFAIHFIIEGNLIKVYKITHYKQFYK